MKRLRYAPTLFILLTAAMPSVLTATRLSLPSIPDFRLPSGGSVNTVFPAATGGAAPYSYGASGLPPGISFFASTRGASGTLPTVSSETTYTVTYSVTDGAGASASVSFSATVVPPPAPPPPPSPPPPPPLPPPSSLSLPTIPDFTLPSGGSVDTVLPAATGGAPPYTYSVSGLPPGVTFAAGTRRASGTLPTVTVDTGYTVTYSVRDGAGATASVTFTTTVTAPPPSPGPVNPPAPPPDDEDDDDGPGVSIARLRSLPFTVSETASGEKSYQFIVSSTDEITVSLTGMDRDIDCRVNSSRCTNRGGTSDDSWGGTLGPGTHTVTVYPYNAVSGSWTLSVSGTVPHSLQPSDPPTTPVDVVRLYSLPFSVSETDEGEKEYRFSLSSSDEVTVSLTGMNRDIDCRVNNSRCTNRGGTRDDSWSGTLNAGTHTVTVYPYGADTGNWTLSVTGTTTSPPPSPTPPSTPTRVQRALETRVGLVYAAETGDSGRTYSFSLASSQTVSVSLTGMNRDIDCSVNGSYCTNRWGTRDDDWSGTLAAGSHSVRVYPYLGGTGNWTITALVNCPAGHFAFDGSCYRYVVPQSSVAAFGGGGPEVLSCDGDTELPEDQECVDGIVVFKDEIDVTSTPRPLPPIVIVVQPPPSQPPTPQPPPTTSPTPAQKESTARADATTRARNQACRDFFDQHGQPDIVDALANVSFDSSDPSPNYCANNPTWITYAEVGGRNTIFTCPPFYNGSNAKRADAVLHEMLHIAGKDHADLGGPSLFHRAVMNACP